MGNLFATLLPMVATIASTIITGLAAIYIPKLCNAFAARTGVQISEQQRQVVLGAIQTAAGTLETDLDNRVLQRTSISPLHPAVRAQAQAVMEAVPDAAGALGMTMAGLSRMIVGRTDTAAHPPLANQIQGGV